jgi:ABC-type nickel/cobalt efflux system permease component RcnA
LSGIIINENLKLLQINYLARKVDFCLIFLLGHIVLVTEPMAQLCTYIRVGSVGNFIASQKSGERHFNHVNHHTIYNHTQGQSHNENPQKLFELMSTKFSVATCYE